MTDIFPLRLAALLLVVPSLLSAAQEPWYDLNGLWLMGQSLAEGAESIPIVTSQSRNAGTFSFRRGVRTWRMDSNSLVPEQRPDSDFQLVPLVASTNGSLGETIANGLADHLRASLSTPAPEFLVAYAGQGGRFIDELSWEDQGLDERTPEHRRNGGFYKTSLDDARRAVVQARSIGKTFGIPALIWMQGEANGGAKGGIHPNRWDEEILSPEGLEWYRDRLIEYRKRWSTDLTSITGQVGEIPLFTYQTIGPAGLAQLMASDLDPHLYLIGPHYVHGNAIDSTYPDGRHGDPIHLSADGQRWFGEQAAKVIRRVLVLREPWQPLRPLIASINAERTIITLELKVPVPPLVIDTQFLPPQMIESGEAFQTLYGFSVRTEKGPWPLKEIVVSAPDRLAIRLERPLPANTPCTLSYGHPNVGVAGSVGEVHSGTTPGGKPTTELLLNAPLPSSMGGPLEREGTFFILVKDRPDPARAPVRRVTYRSGRPVLHLLDEERRKGLPFAPGDVLVVQRPSSYGNVRDSDATPSLYCFGDSTYGQRSGQPYPLWNWLVLFKDLPVHAP